MSSAPQSFLSNFRPSFNDSRLNKRLRTLLPSILATSTASLSQLAPDPASTKALNRLLHNPHAALLTLRRDLYSFSYRNCLRQSLNTLIVAHDPSFLSFNSHSRKKHRLKYHNKSENGYWWLNAALIDPYSGRFLGVAHNTLVDSRGPDDSHWVNYAPGIKDQACRREFRNNPNQQFLIQVSAIDEQAPKALKLVHVADSEFDDALAFRAFHKLSRRNHYVIRSGEQRVLQVAQTPWIPKVPKPLSDRNWVKGSQSEGLINMTIRDLISNVPFGNFTKIALDQRGRVCSKKGPGGRWVSLELAALPVRLAKKSERGKRGKVEEEAIWVNMVVVREKRPKAGKKRLQWILITSLPIDSVEQVAFIVNAYMRRWRIEEFFRTCKQTLKIEESRLERPRALAKMLCLIVVKQMYLDDLRKQAGIEAGKRVPAMHRNALKKALARARRIEKRVRNGGKAEKFSEKQGALMELALMCHYGHWQWTINSHLGNRVLTQGQEIFQALQAEGLYCWLKTEEGD